MTIVYLYTALCTVGGADRSIIQKANYLADEMHQDVFIITDSQKERPPVFPISSSCVRKSNSRPNVLMTISGFKVFSQYSSFFLYRCIRVK